MKSPVYIQLISMLLLFASFAYGDDVIIPSGKNNRIALPWKYKGGGTNLDLVPEWKTLPYAETGWLSGKPAFGYGASNPLKNTAIPQDASAGGGGVAGSRYPTMYFRNTVFIPNPAIYDDFEINARFDDAIVVWVNGVEAYRNNIAANPVYATLANTAIAGNGSTVFTGTISKSLFNAGNNIIAVEIHQVNATTSDMFFDMELKGLQASLTRGPYLQVGNETAVTIRWRTATASNSKLTWGTNFGIYPDMVSDAVSTTEHQVRITGLEPDTKYYYTIGNSSQVISSAYNNYFVTAPAPGTSRKFRFAAIGDCGNASANQVDSKNALLNFMGSSNIDALITLGDNAYSSGLDDEFQTKFFDIYKDDLLRFNKLYMAPGNHDYGNTQANSGVRNNAYYNSFSMPAAAECGGVASGTEAYYSFDMGNVHFVSLDSYGKEDANTTRIYDTTGAQVTWLKNDLAANTKKWVVVYFHHPPYTKTSHTSDTETELVDIRENFIRILERYGADMILCGHSHGYERSYLLKNYYKANAAAPDLMESDFRKLLHTADSSSGLYNGSALSCAYRYNSGKYNHGSMYIVAGSGGQLGGTTAGYPHDAMYYSNVTNGGVLYFETDSNRLDVKFVSYNSTGDPTPVIRDSFTIFKDVNKVQNLLVSVNQPLTLTASWPGTYIWPNNGSATTQSVSVNTSVSGAFDYIVTDANNCLKDSFHILVTPPLPVLINSFTASLANNVVLLNWNTAQEINNKYFTIEKSLDAVTYTLLGVVNAAGNSSVSRSYYLYDKDPVPGNNYYRLSQTDLDGNPTFIGIKKITYAGIKKLQSSIQHKGNGVTNIIISNPVSGMVRMNVYDMAGRQVLARTLFTGNRNSVQEVCLHKGLYIINLRNDNGETISMKMISD